MFDNLDLNSLFTTVSEGLINLVVALAILLLFYIVARVVSGVIRKALSSTDLDNKFAETVGGDSSWPLESVLSKLAFYLIMLFGVIAFLSRLKLDMVAGPLQGMLDTVLVSMPNILLALAYAIAAFVIATIVKMVVTRGADTLQLDQRLNKLDASGSSQSSIGNTLGTALFWLVFLFFLPAILDKLGMSSVVAPLNDMLSSFLNFIPNLLGAAIVFGIGYLVARIVRQILTNVLAAIGIDGFGERAGLDMKLSSIVGTLAYTVILLLVIVQALDKLQISAVSGPATTMINGLFTAIPNMFGAILILGISYVVGKLVAGLVSSLLGGVGFDDVPAKLGMSMTGQRTPSEWVSYVILAGVMLLAGLAATDMLGFEPLSNIVGTFIGFAGQILVGVIVLAIGLWLANLAHDFARNAGMSKFVSSLIRAAVMVLVGSMALNAIGIGEDIVELAFGIGLGAIGIAAALAFGLGSRDIAGREMERFVTSVRSGDED